MSQLGRFHWWVSCGWKPAERIVRASWRQLERAGKTLLEERLGEKVR